MDRDATILAVDDDCSILQMLDEALGSAGYNVLTAAGGWNAVEIFENSP